MSTEVKTMKQQLFDLIKPVYKHIEPHREIIVVVVQALALAILVRVFLFQPFNIPSGSMKPTLLVGDYLFVSKYSYGYSKYSFPLVSTYLFDGRVWEGKPKRGDVAVFRKPTDVNIDYIKRVIGLPGDKVQMIDGQLHINGKAIPKVKTGTFYDTDFGVVASYQETLPNGVKYTVLDRREQHSDNTREYTVPKGYYFMMGDNRDNSADSRDPSVGMVPLENFVGRAEVIFFSSDEKASLFKFWTWPFTTRWSRIFNGVD